LFILTKDGNKSVSTEWQGIKYKETFDDETRGLERRLKAEPNCKIEDLQGILKNLYVMDGQDHDGRGSLQDTIMAATIAAYEQFIANWKAKAN
jgi:hypothetical protein